MHGHYYDMRYTEVIKQGSIYSHMIAHSYLRNAVLYLVGGRCLINSRSSVCWAPEW